MMRGTFANIRLRNQLVPGTEGGYTVHLPSGDKLSIFDAAMRYAGEKVPLVILAGKEYGSGSSRDWAAKGTKLLGVRAVIAESYERIHRSNLIGMGVLPLEFRSGESVTSLGLDGREVYDISGLDQGRAREVAVVARRDDGTKISFQRPGPHRYAEGARILRPRWHPALRSAAAGRGRVMPAWLTSSTSGQISPTRVLAAT